MRLQYKTILLQIVFAAGFFYGMSFFIGKQVSFGLIAFMVGWLGLGQFLASRLLYCPHCGEYPLKTPSGWHVASPGSSCRYCHEPY